MAYRFKHVEHQLYQNTFLKDVRIAVEFPTINQDAVDRNKIQEYFDKFSGTSIKVDNFLERQGINISSNNREIDFRFSLRYAEAKLCTPPYTSFEQARPYWVILNDFLIALGVSEVSVLTVRKYNALYFQSDKQNYDFKEVMGGLFCDELIKMIPDELSGDTALSGFERTWMDSDKESGTDVEVVYGIKKSDSIQKNDCLTLVTMVKSSNGIIRQENVLERANEYNQILFDLFHWCVKEDIINSMKKKL